MSEERTVIDVVMSSLEAEKAGVMVNWKETCLQIVRALQATQPQEDVDDEGE
jgi:hypothetical protein